MTTRMNMGTTVHATSMKVLCVVLDGTGIRLGVEAHENVKHQAKHKECNYGNDDQQEVVQPSMNSATGVTPSCRPSCHGSGWPAAAQAVTDAKRTNIPAIVPASLFAIFIDNPLISSFHSLVLANIRCVIARPQVYPNDRLNVNHIRNPPATKAGAA